MSLALAEPIAVSAIARMPQLRLAFAAIVWRVMLGFVLVKEYLHWSKIGRVPGLQIPRRIGYLLVKLPEALVVGLAVGLGTALVLSLLLRWLTQPRVIGWLQPRDDHSFAMPFAFRLEASEQIEGEWPARRLVGRSWKTGSLVLTDRKLWFFPHAWDQEPWWIERAGLETRLGTVPTPAMSWGYVSGLPDRLTVRHGHRTECFALLDPELVLAHLGYVLPLAENEGLERSFA